jgi:hypothetical protein
MSTTTPPTSSAASGASLVPLARTLEECLRECPGVAGLDPRSGLLTLGREGVVRGVRLRPAAGDARQLTVTLELVGLEGARLPEAGGAACAEVRRWLSDTGQHADEVDVRFTDVAPAPLPLQADAAPEPAEALMPIAKAQPPTAPPPADDLAAEPTNSPQRAELASAVELAGAGGTGERVRVPVPAPAGRRTVLLITVEVTSEEAE